MHLRNIFAWASGSIHILTLSHLIYYINRKIYIIWIKQQILLSLMG